MEHGTPKTDALTDAETDDGGTTRVKDRDGLLAGGFAERETGRMRGEDFRLARDDLGENAGEAEIRLSLCD